jgi:hypothetical protein
MNSPLANLQLPGRTSLRLRLVPLLAAALLLPTACGDDEPSPDDADADPVAADTNSSEPTSKKAERKTLDAATVGSISGVVLATGTVPEPELIQMLGETFCIQTHKDAGGGYLDDRILVQGGKLQNAFVWVKSGLDGYDFEAPDAPVALAQIDCRYTPRILGVQRGQVVEVSSADPVLHNIHTHPENNRPKNIAQPENSPSVKLSFKREEVMLRVACDVHAWMSAWIGVVDHPYFAVTAADGSYRLAGLPPGDYTLGIWHEKLGQKELSVHLDAKDDVTSDEVVYQL